MNPSNDTFILV